MTFLGFTHLGQSSLRIPRNTCLHFKMILNNKNGRRLHLVCSAVHYVIFNFDKKIIFNRINGFNRPGPDAIKLFSCSAQLSLKLILLIIVKIPTNVGSLTFISRINYRLNLQLKYILGYFDINEQFKVYAQLS